MAVGNEKVSRWGMIAMVWQITELHGPSREAEQMTDMLRGLPGTDDQISSQDILNNLPLPDDLGEEQPHEHVGMFSVGLLLWDDAHPEEILTHLPAYQYFVNLCREAEGCWNP